MITSRIDIASIYFHHKNTHPITGEPPFKSLKRLKNELRTNASSVDSNLGGGGGDNGYLDLVLTDEEYSRVVPDTLIRAPRSPGPLVIPPRTDLVEVMNLREAHKRNVNL